MHETTEVIPLFQQTSTEFGVGSTAGWQLW
jgi:hypothetical protein